MLVEFRVLGSLQVLREDGEPVYLRPGVPRLVLAVLLAHSGSAVSVDALVAAAWGEQPPVSARRNLQQYIHQLRAAIGADTITGGVPGYSVLPGRAFDADRFRALAADGLAALDRGDLAAAGERLRTALDLWRGPAYQEFLDCLPLAAEAASLEQLRHSTQIAFARTELARGRHAEVLPLLTDVVRARPFDETLGALLMAALYRTGRQADALQVFRDTRSALRSELGIEPGPELQRIQAAILRGEDPGLDEAAGFAPARAVRRGPHQLPPDTPDFVGRTGEYAVLAGLGDASAVVVAAIDGMAGVGKTALAVHAAHALADSYRDGQLFLDLCGFTAGHAPVEAATALDVLLRAVGVADDRIPATLEERAALWRTEAAGRRMLLVLDNAADAEQVRPLLPGEPGCLVLVTARRRLPGLTGARSLSLDVLSPAEAAELFTAVVGERAAAAPDAVAEVAESCGRLPLAVRIAAARLRHRPAWSVTHLADRLRAQHRRLGELALGATGVAAAFEVSYRYLDEPQRSMFRLLGLHPGIDTDALAAAALADLPADQAEQVLESLLDVHFVYQHTIGRYCLHDLLRDDARARAAAEVPAAGRARARHRLIDYYLAVSRAAADRFFPGRLGIELNLAHPPAATPALESEDVAGRWFATERTNLLAVIRQAADNGHDRHAWLLTRELSGYLVATSHLDEAVTANETALAAARRCADRQGEQISLLNLSAMYAKTYRLNQAIDCTHEAMALADQAGDPRLVALTRSRLSNLYQAGGQLPMALACSQAALPALAEHGLRAEQGYALAGYAHTLIKLGRHREAMTPAGNALAIAQELSSPGDQIQAHILLAMADADLGRLDEALTRIDDAVDQAEQTQRPTLAVDALRIRSAIHRRLGRPDDSLADLTAASARIAGGAKDPYMWEVCLELGHHHAAVGDHAAALSSYREALRLAEGLTFRFDEAHAHHRIATMLRETGDIQAADDHRRLGDELCAELGLDPQVVAVVRIR